MTEIIDDWSQIPVPRDGTRNVSRWDPEHPLDFFRGRDADGNFALVLTALAETTPELPQISGIDIECKAAAENRSELVLTLVDGEQAALFRALCRDLLEATHQLPVEANTQGAIIVIGRIRRWQQLLGKRRNNLLSRQKIIGLVGELLFLENVMLAERPAEEAIRAWRGPYGDEQDFAVADRILETKSQLSSADQVIKVSSEAQLDTISGEIVVWHQTLASTSPNSSGARTLNEHVASIRGKIETKSPVALDIFEEASWRQGTRIGQNTVRRLGHLSEPASSRSSKRFLDLFPAMFRPASGRSATRYRWMSACLLKGRTNG